MNSLKKKLIFMLSILAIGLIFINLYVNVKFDQTILFLTIIISIVIIGASYKFIYDLTKHLRFIHDTLKLLVDIKTDLTIHPKNINSTTKS